jgi:hypothetical protein
MVVYHLLKSWPADPKKDARSRAEKQPLRPNDDSCQCCGLSVFPTEEEARGQYRDLVTTNPGLAGNWRYIAKAELKPHHGKVKRTGGNRPSHHTWWPLKSISRCEVFSSAKAL